MNQRLISQIGKSQRLKIVNRLKRSEGMSVGELAKALGMSYMGVKQHCVELEERRYLDTFRRPKAPGETGRPEMAYRLTRKTHELFPVADNTLTIELLRAAQTLYGPAAPEKLLFHAFQKEAERYLARLKGETLAEKVKWLARLRDAAGHMAEHEEDGDGLRIVEHHSPIISLLELYPGLVARMEQQLFERVLDAPVTRTQAELSGLYCCTFRIG